MILQQMCNTSDLIKIQETCSKELKSAHDNDEKSMETPCFVHGNMENGSNHWGVIFEC
jgi:hypothetical protein